MRGCIVLLLLGCGSHPAADTDGSPGGSHLADAATLIDSARPDSTLPVDGATADATVIDAGTDAAADAMVVPDAGFVSAQHVHILIDNFCNTSADPGAFDVPAGQTLQLTWHNHSVDYDADVWLSYGGGYLGLAQGGTWSDPFQFCTGQRPYDAAGDVSIAGGGSQACPSFRVLIHCR